MAALTWRSRGWASVAVAVQWIGGSRSPGDLHRNATREGVSQGAGQQKRSQRRARDRADSRVGLFQPCTSRRLQARNEGRSSPLERYSRKRLLRSRTISVVCCAILERKSASLALSVY